MSYDINRRENIRNRRKSDKMRKRGGHASLDPPTINWEKVQAVITTVSVLILVVGLLLGIFFLYSDSPAVKQIEIYAGDMSRMVRTVQNATDFVEKSMPPVNMTKALKEAWPQTDEEVKNVTMRGKRVASDLAYLVGDLKESGVIKTIAELSDTIAKILLRPNFDNILDSLETGIPLIFDTLEKEDTKAFIHVVQITLNKIGQLLTEDRVDKVINALDDADVKNLISHASSFIQESTKTARSFNKILDKVAYIADHEKEVVRPIVHKIEHVSHFVDKHINEQMIDDAIYKFKSFDWNSVWKEIKSYRVLLEGIRDHTSNTNTSLVDVGKNLTIEITTLVKQIRESGFIQSSASGLNKIESALTKEEIHDGYVELVSSLNKVNDVLQDLGQHHLMSDFVSLVERFERMEKIVETIFTPLERGMDLYNEEQQKLHDGERGDIHKTARLINSIEKKKPSR